MRKSFQFITSDDWEGLYINGKLHHENHRITAKQLVAILANNGVKIEGLRIDDDYMEDLGNLPKQFDEIDQNMVK